MLHDFLGIALIGMGALTTVARIMARAADFQRRPPRSTIRWAVDVTPGDAIHAVTPPRS
jgi:hypothetical protein